MKLNFTKDQWAFIVDNLRWEYDLDGCECDDCAYAKIIIDTIENHLDVLPPPPISGDIYLDKNAGDVYTYDGKQWVRKENV